MAFEKKDKLIHVACIFEKKIGPIYLFLREIAPQHYLWFKKNKEEEFITSVQANTIREALRLAAREWKNNNFRTLQCGFRYTLPERDEHGTNALFYQMAASYHSINGVYFDEELGANCLIHNASLEAREILKNLE